MLTKNRSYWLVLLLYFSAIGGVLCHGQVRAPEDGARRLQAAAGAEAEAANNTKTNATAAPTTTEATPAPKVEEEVKKDGVKNQTEPVKPVAVVPPPILIPIPIPPEPEGPPPSEVYENIALDRYYHGSLASNGTQKAKILARHHSPFPFADWSPFAQEDDRPWQYYSIDVAK